jgi:hypothetical protein
VAGSLEAGWCFPTGLHRSTTLSKEREMPRKRLIRRFEPRYTVSQEMVDRESKYVHLEHADYLLGSIHDLHEQFEKWRPLWQQVNESAEILIVQQGEREALAYRCMIVRDLYHILELYCACMRKDLPEHSGQDAIKSAPLKPKRVEEEGSAAAIVPFSEWLFERR